MSAIFRAKPVFCTVRYSQICCRPEGAKIHVGYFRIRHHVLTGYHGPFGHGWGALIKGGTLMAPLTPKCHLFPVNFTYTQHMQ